jgi:hypothetical protein
VELTEGCRRPKSNICSSDILKWITQEIVNIFGKCGFNASQWEKISCIMIFFISFKGILAISDKNVKRKIPGNIQKFGSEIFVLRSKIILGER